MENDKAAFNFLANKAIDKGFPVKRIMELFGAHCSWNEKCLRLRHEMWIPPNQPGADIDE